MENSNNDVSFKPDWLITFFATILVSILPILLLLYGLTANNVLIILLATILITFFFLTLIVYRSLTYIRVDNDSISWKTFFKTKKYFEFSEIKEIVFFTDTLDPEFAKSFYGVIDKQGNSHQFPTLLSKNSLIKLADELNRKNKVPVSITTIPWWKGPVSVFITLAILALMCLIVWVFRNL